MNKIFETHAHYDARQFDGDREEVLNSAYEAGIEKIVNVSSSLASCEKSVELSQKFPFVYAAVGVHPDEVGALNEDTFAWMKNLYANEKVVAVGEIGLDYYWNTEPHAVQKQWFIKQLHLARELNLPVIVHSRDAAADTLEVIKEYGKGLRGVIHCFSYSAELAMEYVKLGYYIGVGGVVTFPNGRKLKEVVQAVPLEWIVLETDCPYLSPAPNRGKRNVSGNLVYIAQEIAELKGVGYGQVVLQTWKNAEKLYAI